jgi:SAM-dependent methyltransferase
MASPPRIFDRSLLAARRARALRAARPGAAFLRERVADDLLDRFAAVTRHFSLAVEIGSPAPGLAAALMATGKVERLLRLDWTPASRPDAVADEELLPLAPESIDLAVSVLALHFANDLPGVLAQIRRALKPDGLFLAALLGGDTLAELRQSLAEAEAEVSGGASPRVAPFADLRTLGALLQRTGFALPVIDQDRITVRYAHALDLMRDLRAMGATSALHERSRRPLSRAVLLRAAAIYANRFADPDGRIRATFDVVSLSGWAPHESQQQPLKPGSAKARLADALGSREHSAGEKAPDSSPAKRGRGTSEAGGGGV